MSKVHVLVLTKGSKDTQEIFK